MGDAMTRVYRKGVLEAEGFAVADVSEHLDEHRHGGVGRLLRAVQGPAARARRTSSACTSWPSKTRSAPTSARSSTATPAICSCPCHAVRVDREGERSRRDGDRRLHQRALAHHRPQGRRVRHRARARAMGPFARPRRPRRRASCSTACSTSSSTRYFDASSRSTTTTTQVSEGIFAGATARAGRAAALVRHAPAMVRFHRLVVPMREAVSSLMRREHAGVVRRALSLLPGRLRPHPARQRVLGLAARPGRARSSRRTSACATTARTRS